MDELCKNSHSFVILFLKKPLKTGEYNQKIREKTMFILKELRLEHGLKRSELAREIGINPNTLANYEKGARQASYETLISIADYFNVTLDELLGREEKPGLPRAFGGNPSRLSGEEKRVLADYRRLPPEDKARLKDYLQILTERQYL